MTKCNDKIKLIVNTVKLGLPVCSKKTYMVVKSVYSMTGDRLAIAIPHVVAYDLTCKEANVLKRKIIADYFG